MTKNDYLGQLSQSAERYKSLICMGLDPVADASPFQELPVGERIIASYERLFDAMISRKVFPSAFKPNIGYYQALDRPLEGNLVGTMALARIIQMIRQAFPDIPIILDSKRGDIARSSANYAREAFLGWEADAVTVAPYMGSDSTGPFTSWCAQGRGVYILNRTSNPGGAEIQNLSVCSDGAEQPLYLRIAQFIAASAEESPGTGAVVGATNLQELYHLATFYAERSVPLLIPGVGGQGGSAGETVQKLREAAYPLALSRINSSSGLTHPWKKAGTAVPANWEDVCLDALKQLNEEIRYV